MSLLLQPPMGRAGAVVMARSTSSLLSVLPLFSRKQGQPGAAGRTTAAGSSVLVVPKIPLRCLHVEKRLEELGIELPPAPTPKANYNIVCYASSSNDGGSEIMYISGHLPVQADGTLLTGQIGPKSGGESVKHGYQAARQAGLNIVSTLKDQLGDLDRVKQVVKIFGIVQSADGFKEQHKVMDGCSDVIMEIFGKPVGYHARSAIGTNTLPLDISVEVEAIVEIKK